MALPWIVYQLLTTILRKGGWTLVTIIVALISQGVLKTGGDILRWMNENGY